MCQRLIQENSLTMKILTKLEEWQAIRARISNKTIGFVPTMGNLHTGHLSLCRRSVAENEITVASIFVNSTQFNDARDFAGYPRTLAQDKALLLTCKVDYVLIPEFADMYPDNYAMKVTEDNLSAELEGAFRPGHFNGMLTVVLKFLNLVSPTHAYFGEKDYQQLLLIKQMVQALFLPVKIVACETIRNESGLALSSRNKKLNAHITTASHLHRLLTSAKTTDEIIEELHALGFKVEYIAERWGRRLGAVVLNGVRLIDNVEFRRYSPAI